MTRPRFRDLARRQWRWARLGGLALAAVLLAVTLACLNRPMKRPDIEGVGVWTGRLPQATERDLDILFVIDNSNSMAEEQTKLQAQFVALMQTLRGMRGGLPNVHIGVVSTDLSTVPFYQGWAGCGFQEGGDGGQLLTGTCLDATATPFIKDTAPAGCEVDMTLDASGRLESCGSHDCVQDDCPEGTILSMDELECPRCRNYQGESLESVFGCMAGLGVGGCGFEQPLEAMAKAFDAENEANAGFLRENAFLAVVFITDEDDCSQGDPSLWDNSDTSIDSPLGPLSDFRCFEFGVTCDQSGREDGVRTGCVPREDPDALLHPVSRYVSLLQDLKAPEMMVVAAIAGPVQPEGISVELVDLGLATVPTVQPSCVTGDGSAFPGVRLRSFIETVSSEVDENNDPFLPGWAYTSICGSDYAEALQGVAEKIAVLLDQCPPAPFRGCSDPGVEHGLPGDGRDCNDQCRPECTIFDVVGELRTQVPPCLEVCPDGPCPGNTESLLAYAEGHPLKRDPSLPVASCWQVSYNEQCTESNGGELLVSRQENPPARAVIAISCGTVTQHEQLCDDGEDNDEDCLTDLDDPDCQ